MRRCFVFFSIIFYLSFYDSFVFAQEAKDLDSLLVVLNETKADTVRIDIYLDIHKALASQDTVTSLKYLDDAITLSKQIKNDARLSKAYLEESNFRWRKGQYKRASDALLRVKALIPSLQDPNIEATFYMQQGIIDYYKESYETSVDNFIKAMVYYKTIGDTLGVAKCYSNIGMNYWKLKAYDDAVTHYRKSLETNKNTQDYKFKSGILGNIGLVYKAKKDYKKALDYYQQSLDINRENNQKLDASINLLNIGALYFALEDYNQALRYYQESNQLSHSIDDKLGILYTNHGIGKIKSKLGNYKIAIKKLNEALDQSLEMGTKDETKNIYLSFADLYETTVNPELALAYWKKYETLKDSLSKENYLNKVKKMEMKYNSVEQEKEIMLLTKEAEVQETKANKQAILNNALTGGILLIAIIGGLVFYGMQQKFKSEKMIAAKNEEIKTTKFRQQLGDLENKALRSQMNPHFIFNCMNSINRMIINNHSEDASALLTKFAKLIRLILENSESDMVFLQNELNMLQSYIQLEALTNQTKISFETSIDSNIEVDVIQIPSMVLQPFIENAIWHGLMNMKEGERIIKIAIKQDGDLLKCNIKDNGVGREKALELKNSAVIKTKSMGLSITQRRLQLLSEEKFDEMISFTDMKDVKGQPIGTSVDILIPIS
ncbi:tetratricopeptide repeat-containing sensor histidine kinase [Hyunsoonleella ulvae]|uniref:tetratricopeptide repeat-containing sensor histidine kinase n=1 Tax=Hyunsoonleella ulvae TaxID=2799948 RepID=UPI00193957FF|nr:tetratricopeptide repeat protein [Hyunsoonleella ulvae]